MTSSAAKTITGGTLISQMMVFIIVFLSAPHAIVWIINTFFGISVPYSLETLVAISVLMTLFICYDNRVQRSQTQD